MPRKRTFSKGTYQPQNPSKYAGSKPPIWRSSWELNMMRFFDASPGVLKWDSEPVKIPYKNPANGRQANYIPDFLVVYIDKNKQTHAELIEVKPFNQTTMESAGNNISNKVAAVINRSKWEAAMAWCGKRGIRFRIITERELFHRGRR